MKLLTRLRVGRGADCEVRLDHDTVSRLHATLEWRGGGRLRLIDQDSSNGTFVSESGSWRRIDRVVIEPDREVRFGECSVVLNELLDAFPAFVLAGEAGDAGNLDGAAAEAPEARFERPRRNPSTGDIEDQT